MLCPPDAGNESPMGQAPSLCGEVDILIARDRNAGREGSVNTARSLFTNSLPQAQTSLSCQCFTNLLLREKLPALVTSFHFVRKKHVSENIFYILCNYIYLYMLFIKYVYIILHKYMYTCIIYKHIIKILYFICLYAHIGFICQ